MSTSYYIKAVKPADDKYKQMATAWRACEAAAVDIPESVLKYFNNERPDDVGVVVDLSNGSLQRANAKRHHCIIEHDATEHGRVFYDVDVTLLPVGTRYVRFEIGW